MNTIEEFEFMNLKYSLFAIKPRNLLIKLRSIFQKYGIRVTGSLAKSMDQNIIGNEDLIPDWQEELSQAHFFSR